MTDTIAVDADYLWALEVLACDSLALEGETATDHPDRYDRAGRTAMGANLTRPRDHPRGLEFRQRQAPDR